MSRLSHSRNCYRPSALLRHRALDQSDDGHENRSAYPSASDIAYYRTQVQGTAASRRTSHYALKDHPAEAATDNSCDGIPCRAQAVLFHRRAGNVATDCTANYFNDKTDYIHRFGLLFVRVCSIRASRTRRCDIISAANKLQKRNNWLVVRELDLGVVRIAPVGKQTTCLTRLRFCRESDNATLPCRFT